MSKNRGSLLDAFYNGTSDGNNPREYKDIKPHEVKNATYSLKLANIRYVELRATHFESKSAFINHLIETDMVSHPDIVEMAKQLNRMKEK